MTEDRSAQQVWGAALGELQIQVNKPNYRTWLEKTIGLSFHDGQFAVGVPNTFVAEYLDKNQRTLIEKVLTGLTHNDVQVQFLVDTNHKDASSRYVPRGKPTPAEPASFPLFNPRYTFDSFIVGKSNQLAHAAASGIAQNPGQSYNPLFIYAGAGLGKTHLLHAVGHTAQAYNLKVLYVSAEQYTNQLISALHEKRTQDFRNKFRSVDMLLVDDVQFFSGKEQTEENFFHTFDALHNANHQIVITSDLPPKALPSLQERLRSRFEWGLVTDIQAPDFETRLAILKAKATQKETNIPADVLEFVALQVHQNVRALEGSLNRVIAYAKLVRTKLTPELVAQAIRDISDYETKTVPPTPELIIEAVVNSFQLTPSDLRSRKRDETTALARQVAMYLIRQETDCSLAAIGQALGGRNPATISHAYQKIASTIISSPSIRRKVFNIQRSLLSTAKNSNYPKL